MMRRGSEHQRAQHRHDPEFDLGVAPILSAFQHNPFLRSIVSSENPFPRPPVRTLAQLGGIRPDAPALAVASDDTPVNSLVLFDGTDWRRVDGWVIVA